MLHIQFIQLHVFRILYPLPYIRPIMLELFRDTGLGYVLELFSRDESIVLEANSLVWPYPRYEAGAGRRNGVPQSCVVVTDRSKPHRNSQLSDADGAFVEKAGQGAENCVVGWYGLDDHEVCSISGSDSIHDHT